jgi:uncharacterized delta-60 repeat protein
LSHSDRKPQTRLVAFAAGVLAAAVLAWPAAASAATLAPGSLDPGFAGDGMTVLAEQGIRFTDVQVHDGGAHAGKVVASGFDRVGSSNTLVGLVARFNRDGALDPTFSGDGLVTIGGSVRSTLAIDDFGKVTVGLLDSGVVRLNPNGAADPTFGDCDCGFSDAGGVSPWDIANDFTGADRGDILMVGLDGTVGRLTYDGDVRFTRKVHMKGSPAAPESGWTDETRAVAEASDGDMVVAGTHRKFIDAAHELRRFGVVQLHPNGDLDTGFGNGGGLSHAVGDDQTFAYAEDLVVDSSGRLVLLGNAERPASGYGQPWVLRLAANGSRDATFSGDGMYQHPDTAGLYDIRVDGAGRLVAGGSVDYQELYSIDAGAIRLLPNGVLDTGFGDDGTASVSDVPAGPVGSAMDLGPDGIVVGGAGSEGGASGPMVARFISEELEVEDGDDDGDDDGGGTGDPGGTGGTGGVAGTTAGSGVKIHRVVVANRWRKVIRNGVKVLASCDEDCTIVVEVKVSGRTAIRMRLKSLRFAYGTREAEAGEAEWVTARLTPSAKRGLRTYGGGGRLQIRVRAEAPGGQSAAGAAG